MKTLALVSQKGGVGKSLLTAHLAVAFEEVGLNVVVIDLDDQGSVTKWGDTRRRDSPPVIGAMANRLPAMLATARKGGVDLVIVDTPPYSSNVSLTAIAMADLILVPTRPSIFDLRSIGDTAQILKLSHKLDKAVLVLNAVRPRGAIGNDAEAYAKEQAIEVAPVRITDRAAFADALIATRPSSMRFIPSDSVS